MGPWEHSNEGQVAGEVDFAEASLAGNVAPDRFALERRWFDRWLKGDQNDAEYEPPVRYFTMGGGDGRRTPGGHMHHGGSWHTARTWPPSKTQPVCFYLQADDGLTTETPQDATGSSTYRSDPRTPVPDTDFTVKLVDEHPPNPDYPRGFAMNVTHGIARCRYRDSREKAALMEPGQVYPLEIVCYPTSDLFQKGHRIRVDIAGSNYPHFDLNPNTGGPLGREQHVTPADNTVYHSRDLPSHIALPIMADTWGRRIPGKRFVGKEVATE